MFAVPRFLLITPFLAVILPLSGCREAAPEFGEVEGVVLVRGEPTSGLRVRFVPDPHQGNDLPINASGLTDEQGRFELQHVYEGREGKGAPVGWHRVVIEDTRRSGVPPDQPLPPRIIPIEYNRTSNTPLSIEVEPGQQTIDLEVR